MGLLGDTIANAVVHAPLTVWSYRGDWGCCGFSSWFIYVGWRGGHWIDIPNSVIFILIGDKSLVLYIFLWSNNSFKKCLSSYIYQIKNSADNVGVEGNKNLIDNLERFYWTAQWCVGICMHFYYFFLLYKIVWFYNLLTFSTIVFSALA